MASTLQPPRYQQIAAEMAQQIRRGEYACGSRLPSYPEMRKQGISQNTMEKVYSILESDGLIERSPGSGVYVAQRKSKPSTGLMGFVGVGTTEADPFGMHLYGAHLQEGARESAKKRGFHLVLLDGDADESAWQKLDGVLSAESILEAQRDLPVVQLLSTHQDRVSVIADDASGIREAVDYLIGLGHRRVAYLSSDQEPHRTRRVSAYQEALRQNGISPHPAWVRYLRGVAQNPTKFVGAANIRMSEWLREDWKTLGCTALLCQNDQTALGILEALRAANLQIPRDVSVVGFDGTEAATYAQPNLTTVHVPLFEIGARGVEVLIEQMSGVHEDRTHALPTKLQIGGSTAPPQKSRK